MSNITLNRNCITPMYFRPPLLYNMGREREREREWDLGWIVGFCQIKKNNNVKCHACLCGVQLQMESSSHELTSPRNAHSLPFLGVLKSTSSFIINSTQNPKWGSNWNSLLCLGFKPFWLWPYLMYLLSIICFPENIIFFIPLNTLKFSFHMTSHRWKLTLFFEVG